MTVSPGTTLDMLYELLAEIGEPFDRQLDPKTTTLHQIGLDSLSMLELLMLVDERRGIEVAVEQVKPDTTVTGLAELIDRQQAA